MPKAYVKFTGSTMVALVRIGGTVYEPASGKSWKIKQRWKGQCSVNVPSASMTNAKAASMICYKKLR